MATRRKPFSEMTPAARLAEAQAAISRIEHEMNTVRDGRYGEYGRSCRDSIARWQLIVDRKGAY